jgi:hypothetical protein
MTNPDNSQSPVPEPPKELSAAMLSAVDGRANPTPEQLLDAIDPLLKKVLSTNCEARASALDLLTVDALVTRALELAADDPVELQRVAELAIRSVSAHSPTELRP